MIKTSNKIRIINDIFHIDIYENENEYVNIIYDNTKLKILSDKSTYMRLHNGDNQRAKHLTFLVKKYDNDNILKFQWGDGRRCEIYKIKTFLFFNHWIELEYSDNK